MKKFLPYLLVSPYLAFVCVFVLFPVLFCLFLTFHRWNIIAPMHFIGAGNYTRLVHDRLFWKAIGNTLKFLSLHIPLQLVVKVLVPGAVAQPADSGRGFFPGQLLSAGDRLGRGGDHPMAARLPVRLLDSGMINRMLAGHRHSQKPAGWSTRNTAGSFIRKSRSWPATLEEPGSLYPSFPGGDLHNVPRSPIMKRRRAGRGQPMAAVLAYYAADDQPPPFFSKVILLDDWRVLALYRTLYHDRGEGRRTRPCQRCCISINRLFNIIIWGIRRRSGSFTRC